jgi:hypothetical protein
LRLYNSRIEKSIEEASGTFSLFRKKKKMQNNLLSKLPKASSGSQEVGA